MNIINKQMEAQITETIWTNILLKSWINEIQSSEEDREWNTLFREVAEKTALKLGVDIYKIKDKIVL